MAFKFKGSLSAVDATLKGGVKFDNEKLPDSKNMPEGKFTINEIDNSSTTDIASNTLVTNFGKPDNVAGMLSFNTGDWENNNSAPVKLMMRVVNNNNDSDWVTIFDSSKTTVTWSSVASAGQTVFTVPNLDFKKAIIYINGILQYPGISYQTFGGTVTFSNYLQSGDNVYIVVGKDSDNTTNIQYISTATTEQNTITLPYSRSSNYVYINGILQYPSTFTISNDIITLNSSMQEGDNIFVLSNEKTVSNYTSVAVQDQTDFTISGTIVEPIVYVNGVLQYDDYYSISGNTLSFVGKLFEGDQILVFLDNPQLIDDVNTEYTNIIDDTNNSNKINIPYFHFSELQVFINGILQNPDNGAYDLNGTEITLSSPLQEGDDIHVIVYNSPIQDNNIVTKADLSSYASINELNLLKDSLKAEGINLKWQPHLPSIEVAFGLPRRSLKIWKAGNTSTANQYWLYPVDGTVWAGVGILGTVPDVPFYKLDSNKDVITWTYTATSDNINRIFVPYNFGSINIFINGVFQSVELGHYTYTGQYINLNGALQTGDNLIAILGKLILNTNPYLTIESASKFITKSDIYNTDGAEKIGTSDGRNVQINLNEVSDFNKNLESNNQNLGANLINTEIDISVGKWIKNTVITPDMFFDSVNDVDWLPAFTKAAAVSMQLKLPVTLLPRDYTFLSALNMSMFGYGIVCDMSRNNKVVLKALANNTNAEVFITMKNVDRRKTGGFLIDANNLYDVAFDTTWDLTGGPSLMMVWEKIQIQGWKKIGWRANNNNDVWNKNITILEPGADVSSDAVSYYNHSAGGPISFEGCSFQGGRIQVTAQHISASYCVFRGVEIKTGGSGWNTFAAIGCHFFKDTYYNSCFVLGGNIQGFTVMGGLVEPTDGGSVFRGLGTGYFNCGQLELLNTRISSYNSSNPAVLASGTMLSVYGNTTIKITGGIAELSSYDPSTMGWVNTLICDKVLLNQLNNTPITRIFTGSLCKYNTPTISSVSMASATATSCMVTDMLSTLSTTSRNFGNIAALDGSKTTISGGTIRLSYSDGGGFAEFRYTRTSSTNSTFTLISESYIDSSRQLTLYNSGTQYVYVANSRAAGTTGSSWTLLISFSGYLDYIP